MKNRKYNCFYCGREIKEFGGGIRKLKIICKECLRKEVCYEKNRQFCKVS